MTAARSQGLAECRGWIAALSIGLVGVGGVQAQSEVSVSLQVYAGLTITGSAGSNYVVQYVTDLSQTNRWSNWQTLTNLVLPDTSYLWSDLSVPANGKRFYRVLSPEDANNPTPSKLSWIRPGNFIMGSPSAEAERDMAETPHPVTISKGFYMGKYLVTQSDYRAVMGINPSRSVGDDNKPVEQVTWNDATAYCIALTQQEQAAGRLPAGWTYRLPTESEWEYACRAGTQTAFYFGNEIREGQANFYCYDEYNSTNGTVTTNTAGVGFSETTTPVGHYGANPWGLYDMCGNVWEWCQDWYGDYPAGSVVDPAGPIDGSLRVMRGGSWFTFGRYCRSAYRSAGAQTGSGYLIGFRVVLAPVGP